MYLLKSPLYIFPNRTHCVTIAVHAKKYSDMFANVCYLSYLCVMKPAIFLLLALLTLLSWENPPITHGTIPTDALHAAKSAFVSNGSRIHNKRYITVIDYRQNILSRRLWVYDVIKQKVVLHCRVSHALNSGLLHATDFSNVDGSLKSCTGNFITQKVYNGRFGYSMRIKGISSTNTNAYSRSVVFHSGIKIGALEYRGPTYSFGCFVTNRQTNKQLLDLIAGGSLVFVYKG